MARLLLMGLRFLVFLRRFSFSIFFFACFLCAMLWLYVCYFFLV